MEKDFVKEWKKAAFDVWKATHAPVSPGTANLILFNRSVFGQHFNGFVDALPTNLRSWDGETQAALAARYRVAGTPLPPFENVARMKAIRLGYALASGNVAMATRSEASQLSRLGLGRDLDDVASRLRRERHGMEADPRPCTAFDSPEPGESFRAEFAFAYRAPRRGSPRSRVAAVGRSWTTVTRVDPAEARKSWSLPLPDGSVMDVIVSDGKAYRPILAPGTDTPLDERGFLEACAGGECWADDPFSGWEGQGALAFDEYCETRRDTVAEDVASLAEARRAALTSAGALISVGGLVYRETEPPRIHLVRMETWQRGVPGDLALTWKVAGTSGMTSRDPIPDTARPRPQWHPFEALGAAAAGTLSFPASLAELAVDATLHAAASASARGLTSSLRPERPSVFAVVRDDPVEALRDAMDRRAAEIPVGTCPEEHGRTRDALSRLTDVDVESLRLPSAEANRDSPILGGLRSRAIHALDGGYDPPLSDEAEGLAWMSP